MKKVDSLRSGCPLSGSTRKEYAGGYPAAAQRPFRSLPQAGERDKGSLRELLIRDNND